MFRKTIMLGLLGALLSVGALAGCEANEKHEKMSGMQMGADKAVMCSKCQITWVKAPVANDKGRIVAYKTEQSMECPDCKSAVANFFSTGNLEHTCKSCGGEMKACAAHAN